MLLERRYSPRCIRHLLVALTIFWWLSALARFEEITDFISINTLPDGEVETRIYYRGVVAKETTTAKNKSLKFRQLSRGKRVLQLIYSDDKLVDCEFLHQKLNSTFLYNFKSDMRAIVTPNSSIAAALLPLDGVKTLPRNYAWVNWTRLRNACKRRHKEIQKEVRKRREAILSDRSKRDASSMFLVPGTKWCGKGYSADKYTRLGGFSRTDRCCRKHDLACPFWIGAFETKYGIFNWRMNTLMHCNCDERFRACLKRVGTSDANLVGKLFFNFVQTKCFVLKPKKKCVRSSWWGKCEKHKVVKQAILRDNSAY